MHAIHSSKHMLDHLFGEPPSDLTNVPLISSLMIVKQIRSFIIQRYVIYKDRQRNLPEAAAGNVIFLFNHSYKHF